MNHKNLEILLSIGVLAGMMLDKWWLFCYSLPTIVLVRMHFYNKNIGIYFPNIFDKFTEKELPKAKKQFLLIVIPMLSFFYLLGTYFLIKSKPWEVIIRTIKHFF